MGDRASPAKDRLTNREERFCREYVAMARPNVKTAMLRAGYSRQTASSRAATIMARPRVVRRIDELNAQAILRAESKADRVVQELEWLAHSNIADLGHFDATGFHFHPSDELPREVLAAVAEVTTVVDTISRGEGKPEVTRTRTQVKMIPKLPALRMLAEKHQLLAGKRDPLAVLALFLGVQVNQLPPPRDR